MNHAQLTKKFIELHSSPRLLVGVGSLLITMVAELFFCGKIVFGGYSDGVAIGIGVSYGMSSIVFIWATLPFVRAIKPVNPITSAFVYLIGPLAIQLFILFRFLTLIVSIPLKRREVKVLPKSAMPKQNRIEKLSLLRVGDIVTFEPPNEAPVIGAVRRINAKSTTIVSQSGEMWRVPHDSSGKIVKTTSKRSRPRQLDLVR